MKKRTKIIAYLLIAIILLTPVRMKLDDGGSIKYKSLIYEVTKIHKLYLQEYDEGEDPYLDGWEIKLFGVSIYKETWNEDAKDSRVQ